MKVGTKLASLFIPEKSFSEFKLHLIHYIKIFYRLLWAQHYSLSFSLVIIILFPPEVSRGVGPSLSSQ